MNILTTIDIFDFWQARTIMSAVDGIVSFFVCMDEECERMREIEAEGYTTCAETEEQGKEKTKDKCGHEEWEVIMSVDIPNRENILLV